MELTIKQTNITKGVAILMMLALHLFNTLDYKGLFTPLLFVAGKPITYYISLFCDCCVAIYCFCSGYGLYIGYLKKDPNYNRKNNIRILKLLINYWIVLLLFAVGLGIVMGKSEEFPGSFSKFILNFTTLDCTYNGAWWFVSSYVLLVLSSSFIFKILEKYNFRIVLIFSFAIYVVFYVQRIKIPIQFHQLLLDLLLKQITLLGNCQFPFVIGAIVFQQKWYSKFSALFDNIKFKNYLFLFLIFATIVFHAVIPTLFVAAFTGIFFVFCFNGLQIPNFLDKILQYLSGHSTNIWLTHMFFYLIFFRKFIFAPQYPILIYLWLIFCSLVASYFVNLFYLPVIKWLDTKIKP
jgi:surface polysaccharide O-acyltransferase-like enzyme